MEWIRKRVCYHLCSGNGIAHLLLDLLVVGSNRDNSYIPHYNASAFSKLKSLAKRPLMLKITISLLPRLHDVVHSAGYSLAKANRVAACQW